MTSCAMVAMVMVRLPVVDLLVGVKTGPVKVVRITGTGTSGFDRLSW